MLIECPNCQNTIPFDIQKLESDPRVVCEACLTFLSLKIVPELVTVTGQIEENGPIADIPLEQSTTTDNEFKNESNESEDMDEPPEPRITFGNEDQDTGSDELDYPTSTPEETTAEKEKVLICIDGEATRELVQDVLNDANYHLLDIPSEMATLMSAEIDPPAIALIDAGLSNDDTSDLCNQLRKNPAFNETVFILVGSMYEKNTRDQNPYPSLLGANDYIGRYYIQRDLLETIRKNLDSKNEPPNERSDDIPLETDDRQPLEENFLKPQKKPLKGDPVKPLIHHAVEIESDEAEALETTSGELENLESKPIESLSRELGTDEAHSPEYPSFELEDEEIETENEEVKPIEGLTSELKNESLENDTNEHDEAKRLARIIVSDIFIYNEDKIEEGIRNETFFECLDKELEEGRQLYASRVSESLRAISNYYEEMLENAVSERKETSFQELNTAGIPNKLIQKDEKAVTPLEPTEEKNTSQVGSPDTDEEGGYAQTVSQEAPEKNHYSQPVSLNTTEEDSEEVKSAKRLARIIVSDIVIYNEEKVEEGLQSDTFYEVLEEEIEEGRQLYEARVDRHFLNDKDYLQEAFDNFISKKKTAVS